MKVTLLSRCIPNKLEDFFRVVCKELTGGVMMQK